MLKGATTAGAAIIVSTRTTKEGIRAETTIDPVATMEATTDAITDTDRTTDAITDTGTTVDPITADPTGTGIGLITDPTTGRITTPHLMEVSTIRTSCLASRSLSASSALLHAAGLQRT